jgi:hypothetical protein
MRNKVEASSPEFDGILLGVAMLHILPVSLVWAAFLNLTASAATFWRGPSFNFNSMCPRV